jgi:large subunit ribosomal protein L23
MSRPVGTALHDIIRRPVLTEKSTDLKAKNGILCFEVPLAAHKADVKTAFEKIFSRKVAGVRFVNVLGKTRKVGKFAGKRADWKKAYITLKDGEKPLEYHEGF